MTDRELLEMAANAAGLQINAKEQAAHSDTHSAWLAWQARAALSADGGEPHREAKVGPLIYEACGSLPEGWRVRIEFENGYGGVVLVDPYDEERDMRADRDAPTIAEQLREAIDAAIAANQAAEERKS
ncbi:hypothetical protein PHO31112_00745 [Pandoraea horticolens]|uniref:Uncharacterized protein n=1 Tax=Pandoraea horticolens TaxID=2508298 RepID=A0A5E4SFW9_9BURK|nr:hypothetical protein [Pandoraea horticolens]VVD74205.1 hypothetical protein PHO31112_00745 [Pandoraea horticolens]